MIYPESNDPNRISEVFLLDELTTSPWKLDALYHHYGHQFFLRKKFSLASKDYLRAIDLNSNVPEIYKHLGFIYLNSKKYQKAESAYRMALKFDPNYSTALAKLGICLAAQKKYSQAEVLFKRAIKVNPGNAENYLDFGHFYYYLKRNYREAKRLYQKALALNPRLSMARNNIRDINRKFKKWREQEGRFKNSWENDYEYEISKESGANETPAGNKEEGHIPETGEKESNPRPLF